MLMSKIISSSALLPLVVIVRSDTHATKGAGVHDKKMRKELEFKKTEKYREMVRNFTKNS